MWTRWAQAVREWAYRDNGNSQPSVRIGVALGGGFARCLAHVGVLQVFEEQRIPIHAIAGISSGAMVAAAYASGTPLEEIVSTGACTSFSSYARWTLSRVGLASNERMAPYLRKILRHTRFEEMQKPVAVVATDLVTGAPVVFRDQGDIVDPIRASCAYPGLFLPVEINGRWLVDGAISANVPVSAVAQMGATHVIAVYLQTVPETGSRPASIFQVVSRCFAIMQDRMIADWRQGAHLMIEPDVRTFAWDDFGRVSRLVAAGRAAALEALPQIRAWLEPRSLAHDVRYSHRRRSSNPRPAGPVSQPRKVGQLGTGSSS